MSAGARDLRNFSQQSGKYPREPGWTPKTGNQSTGSTPAIKWDGRDVDARVTQQQILAVGRLGWMLSRIQKTTAVRRETIRAI
jgi:hypothetical protein